MYLARLIPYGNPLPRLRDAYLRRRRVVDTAIPMLILVVEFSTYALAFEQMWAELIIFNVFAQEPMVQSLLRTVSQHGLGLEDVLEQVERLSKVSRMFFLRRWLLGMGVPGRIWCQWLFKCGVEPLAKFWP